MRLYLVRHGESLGNTIDVIQGHINFDLTETGYQQAQQLAERFKDIHLDKIYCSDLRRAMNTAAPVAEKKGLTIICDSRLRERSQGTQEGRLTSRIPKEVFDELKTNPDAKFEPDGESFTEHRNRVIRCIDEVFANESGDASLLIVAHGGTLQGILHYLLDLSFEEVKDRELWGTNNTCIYCLSYEEGGKMPEVHLKNCTKHLR